MLQRHILKLWGAAFRNRRNTIHSRSVSSAVSRSVSSILFQDASILVPSLQQWPESETSDKGQKTLRADVITPRKLFPND